MEYARPSPGGPDTKPPKSNSPPLKSAMVAHGMMVEDGEGVMEGVVLPLGVWLGVEAAVGDHDVESVCVGVWLGVPV